MQDLDRFHEEAGARGLADPREAGHARHIHPSAKEYVRIGMILVVLTALEVWISYSSLPHGLLIGLLFFLAFVKFALVALWFMHLRFDSRIFRRLFVTGILLAFAIFTIVLATFGRIG